MNRAHIEPTIDDCEPRHRAGNLSRVALAALGANDDEIEPAMAYLDDTPVPGTVTETKMLLLEALTKVRIARLNQNPQVA